MARVSRRRPRRRKIRIVERKLNRRLGPNIRKIFGLAHTPDNLLEIEPRQKPRAFLNTLIHELLHVEFPELGECAVCRIAGEITEQLWLLNFRRVSQP